MTLIHTPSAPKTRELAESRSRSFEGQFISKLLQIQGVGSFQASLFGSEMADQFSSFFCDAVAERVVSRGGLGISEAIYRSLLDGA